MLNFNIIRFLVRIEYEGNRTIAIETRSIWAQKLGYAKNHDNPYKNMEGNFKKAKRCGWLSG